MDPSGLNDRSSESTIDGEEWEEIDSVSSSDNVYPEDGNQARFTGFRPVGFKAVTSSKLRLVKDATADKVNSFIASLPPPDELKRQARLTLAHYRMTEESQISNSSPHESRAVEDSATDQPKQRSGEDSKGLMVNELKGKGSSISQNSTGGRNEVEAAGEMVEIDLGENVIEEQVRQSNWERVEVSKFVR